MSANELRTKYLEFFRSKGHAVIPSASLIPENDPTVLFTTAGMHPLVPFLLGEPHPAGKRLVNYQRCIRTGDIDLVGDDIHLTFFEMLGNWSFGDPASPDGIGGGGYFKKEAIEWSWEFLTGRRWLGLDPERIYVSCFAGDKDAPRDDESARHWMSVGVPEERIAFLGKEDNWWGPAGPSGPCGPDTEMYYRVDSEDDERPKGAQWPRGKYVEIWNDVFMEYNLRPDGVYEPLKQKNVDTGMGVERTLVVLDGVDSVYKTELFSRDLEYLRDHAKHFEERSVRVILDHLKASVFLIADGIVPSNKEQGYVLRRLLRKVVREAKRISIPRDAIEQVVANVIGRYGGAYSHLIERKTTVLDTIDRESEKFTQTLEKGQRYLTKQVATITDEPGRAGEIAFNLHQTYGFPPELTFEILTKEKRVPLEWRVFDALYREYLAKHQELSRKGAELKFAGGLADHSERVVRMHTATHLLHQALRDVLGGHVFQKGSNITAERLRFDFTHPKKMTKDEVQKVEELVNRKVQEALPVTRRVIPLAEARTIGAIGLFGEKYGDTVSVYTVGDYSKEFCGGPHVQNTKEIGKFTILKEEAVSAGVRRIKAAVE